MNDYLPKSSGVRKNERPTPTHRTAFRHVVPKNRQVLSLFSSPSTSASSYGAGGEALARRQRREGADEADVNSNRIQSKAQTFTQLVPGQVSSRMAGMRFSSSIRYALR